MSRKIAAHKIKKSKQNRAYYLAQKQGGKGGEQEKEEEENFRKMPEDPAYPDSCRDKLDEATLVIHQMQLRRQQPGGSPLRSRGESEIGEGNDPHNFAEVGGELPPFLPNGEMCSLGTPLMVAVAVGGEETGGKEEEEEKEREEMKKKIEELTS